jgi:hypothetical protein
MIYEQLWLPFDLPQSEAFRKQDNVSTPKEVIYSLDDIQYTCPRNVETTYKEDRC